MDSIVTNLGLVKTNNEYNIEELKKVYQQIIPLSEPVVLNNILSEYSDLKEKRYDNSGGWENNSNYTVEIPHLTLYYVYVSKTNTVYKQKIYDTDYTEYIEANNATIYDDGFVKIVNNKYVVISKEDDFGNVEYAEIFNPEMQEGKYLYFVEVVTENRNVFFSDIEIINCKKAD